MCCCKYDIKNYGEGLLENEPGLYGFHSETSRVISGKILDITLDVGMTDKPGTLEDVSKSRVG